MKSIYTTIVLLSFFIIATPLFAAAPKESKLWNDIIFDQNQKAQEKQKYEHVPLTDMGEGFYRIDEYVAPNGDIGYAIFWYDTEKKIILIEPYAVATSLVSAL